MKKVTRIVLLLIILAALFIPQAALAQGPGGDEFVFGGTYTLAEGETLDGNLYVFGGIATLENRSIVNGDIILAGGTLQVRGEVRGDITATGGLINLDDTAVVRGDVSAFAAHVNRAQGARVDGSLNTGLTGPFRFVVPGGVRVPSVQLHFDPLWDTLWFLFRSFMWAAVAVLVVLFLPRNTERTAQAAVNQPLISFGLGLLTAVVAPLLLVVIAITIIGIPLTLLGALLLAIAWGFGLIALGTEVGKRLAQLFNQEWALAVAAGVGTFLLILVSNGASRLVPCVGWLVPAAVGMLGLGAVLLTRLGTQTYPPYAASPEVPPPVQPYPPPPAPPAEPVAVSPAGYQPRVEPTVPPTSHEEVYHPPVEKTPPPPPAESGPSYVPYLPPVEPGPVEPEDEERRPGGAQSFPAE